MNRWRLVRSASCLIGLQAFICLALVATLQASDPADPLTAFFEQAGPSPVETLSVDWKDESRDRTIPAKIYYPTSGEKLPVIIFSHGLGGSREGYEYLGRHWASHGYVSIHVQHVGSDSEVWRGNKSPMEALKKAAGNLKNSIDRPKDVSFAIDQIEKLNANESALRGRLDKETVGVSGHSFGGYTTMAIAGQVFVTPAGEQTMADPRVKAALPMSAPSIKRRDQLERAYGKITMPIYAMTGTLDDSPIGETSAADRRVPYDNIANADKFLLILTGGDHMVFGGKRSKVMAALRGKTDPSKEEAFHKIILGSSVAFWDTYLKSDSKAREWLVGSGFRDALGKEGTFEMKLQGAAK